MKRLNKKLEGKLEVGNLPELGLGVDWWLYLCHRVWVTSE